MDLFGGRLKPTLYQPGRRDYVPPAARHIVYAIRTIGRPATEKEIVEQCVHMRRDYMTDFDLGMSSNLRNRIQRNWAEASIYKNKWAHKGYAAIFIRIKKPGEPVRWWVEEWYKP